MKPSGDPNTSSGKARLITIWDILKHQGILWVQGEAGFNNNMGYIETSVSAVPLCIVRRLITIWDILKHSYEYVYQDGTGFNNNMGYIETPTGRIPEKIHTWFNNNMGYIETE